MMKKWRFHGTGGGLAALFEIDSESLVDALELAIAKIRESGMDSSLTRIEIREVKGDQ